MKICLTASRMLESMLPDVKPDGGKSYRPSMYNFTHLDGEHTYIYNVLTRRLARLTEEEVTLLQADAVCGDVAAAKALIAKRFLIACDVEETAHYLQLFSTQELFLSSGDRGYKTYRILTTTGCNARCFYCFEQGACVQNMTEDTADAVIAYIVKTHDPDATVELAWFGGEPLLRPAVIDRICSGLSAAGVAYRSTMTTNGSLFTPQLMEKAKDLWKLEKVQITLDGVGEEHERRKAYVSLPDAYKLTLERISQMIKAGIGVIVRMNMDLQNAENIHELYDALRTRYSSTEPIAFDPALLFEELIGGERTRTAQQQATLRESWLQLRQRIWEDGFCRVRPLLNGLPRWHCMANSPETAIVLPDGKLTVCDPGCESMYYGDVWQGVTHPELVSGWRRCTDLREKCRNCPYLPECTGFALCPYEVSDCRAQAEEDLRRRLAVTVAKYGR